MVTQSENIIANDRPEEYKVWLREYRSYAHNPDIHRILRYAVWSSALDIAKQLMDHEGADLYQLDSLGRSAIFYATQATLDMLRYVVSDQRFGFKEELLIKKDKSLQTPLHYAAKLDSRENLELLASKITIPHIRDRIAPVVRELTREDSTSNESIWQSFIFKKLAFHYPQINFSVEYYTGCRTYPKQLVHSIYDLQQDSNWTKYQPGFAIWVHVPATNVSARVVGYGNASDSSIAGYLPRCKHPVSLFVSN